MEDNRVLSNEIFETAREYLPRLINGLEKASEHFKEEDNAAGLHLLSEAGDGLSWFNQVVLGLPVIIPQGENTADISENWVPYLDALKSTLGNIEKMDTAAIAFSLDQEIIPFIKVVHGKIINMTRHIPYAN